MVTKRVLDGYDCPVCGDPGIVHIGRSPVLGSRHIEIEPGETAWANQGTIKIPMQGEACACLFFLCIGQHKGSLQIYYETTDKRVFAPESE